MPLEWFVLCFVLAALALTNAQAQDDVTIPKSRLKELERKEAELDKLKGELKNTKGENEQLKKQHEADAAKISAAQPVPTHVSPPIASLPALTEGDTIDAMDLANHYREDPAAADLRYRKRTLKLQGEIVGFEKPPFLRNYRILLKTPDRNTRIVCDFYPPEKYQAIFTAKNGTELVGEVPRYYPAAIAKVGDTVLIQGECKGMSDSTVKLSGCELKSRR